jgi:hypothetical protein
VSHSRRPCLARAATPETGPLPLFCEPDGTNTNGDQLVRTFVVGTTKIDVIAHISREDLELDRLILRRFEGAETLANAAFQTLVDRYRDRPLAEYAVAPQEVELS